VTASPRPLVRWVVLAVVACLVLPVLLVASPARSGPRLLASPSPAAGMAADCNFNGTPEAAIGPVRIREVQGTQHRSPVADKPVVGVAGVVVAVARDGFWLQDPIPDEDDATSEGLFVLLGNAAASGPSPGRAVVVAGCIREFRRGAQGPATLDQIDDREANLGITELVAADVAFADEDLHSLPPPVIVGAGGRRPPTEVVDDDASGDAEATGPFGFDPDVDGLDFWESLEGMRVQITDAAVVGPRAFRDAVPVLADGGANASGRTARGGIAIRLGAQGPDFNPERAFIDGALLAPEERWPLPQTGDRFPGPMVGVVDYAFGRYRILATEPPAFACGELVPGRAQPAAAGEVAIATLNVHNLAARDPDLSAGEEQEKFNRLAGVIVGALGAPDLLVLEEIQDANGKDDDAEVDADPTAQRLVDAILAAGGPHYVFKDIDPVDDQDGGVPGGNIRVGFLFRTDRGLAWVERDPGEAMTPVAVVTETGDPQLSVNPGRIAPADRAFLASRKPLVGEFAIGEQRLFVVGVHLASQLGGTPLFGRPQPPWVGSATQRVAQAHVVADFLGSMRAADPDALVVVLGDFNDFWFSETVATLEAAGLANLMATLPEAERYTFVFEGNSQALDQMLVSPALAAALVPQGFAIVHANAEFADQATDHDPLVARFALGIPSATPIPVATPVAMPTATPRAGCT
jgi:uncharacterized protein